MAYSDDIVMISARKIQSLHLTCPKCQGPTSEMHLNPKNSVRFCQKCKLIGFEEGQLARFLGDPVDLPQPRESLFLADETRFPCPICSDTLLREIPYLPHESMKIDRCSSCGMIWLDQGELKRIQVDYFAHRKAAFEGESDQGSQMDVNLIRDFRFRIMKMYSAVGMILLPFIPLLIRHPKGGFRNTVPVTPLECKLVGPACAAALISYVLVRKYNRCPSCNGYLFRSRVGPLHPKFSWADRHKCGHCQSPLTDNPTRDQIYMSIGGAIYAAAVWKLYQFYYG